MDDVLIGPASKRLQLQAAFKDPLASGERVVKRQALREQLQRLGEIGLLALRYFGR